MSQGDLEELYSDVEVIEVLSENAFRALDELRYGDDWTQKIEEELSSWLHELKQDITSYMN